MSVERDQRADGDNAASHSWLARLFLLIAALFEVFANTTPRQYREAAEARSDWRDHWPNLRRCEWHLSQILAREAMELITGRPIPFELIVEPPEGYGGPCPKSPAELARRFAFTARWMSDLDTLVLRHTRRIAKRMGLTYRGCPLRHSAAPNATSPALRAEEENICARRNRRSLSSSDATRRGRWRATSSSRDGGGSHRLAFNALPRAPPTSVNYCLFPTANSPQTPRV